MWRKLQARTNAAASRHSAGFTLVEILVALALMAAVLPVVSQGMKLATLAGEVSQRKSIAMRLAEEKLNETIVSGQWNQAGQTRSVQLGGGTYRWVLHNDPWSALNNTANVGTANGINVSYVNPSNLHLLTVDVTFLAQNRPFTVHLSTVVDITKQVQMNSPPSQ